MAIARASAVSSGFGGDGKASSIVTIDITCFLSALPYPTTEDEAWIMVQIADAMRNSEVPLRVLHPDGEIELVDGILMTYPRITRIDRSARPVTYLSFSDGDERVTYISASSWEDGLPFADKLEILACESDMLIIGAYGPVNKKIFDIPLDHPVEVYVFDDDPACLLADGSTLSGQNVTVNCNLARFKFNNEE